MLQSFFYRSLFCGPILAVRRFGERSSVVRIHEARDPAYFAVFADAGQYACCLSQEHTIGGTGEPVGMLDFGGSYI